MTANSGLFPVLAWLQANGVDPDTVAFEDIAVVDETIVYYRTHWKDNDRRSFAMHGDEVLSRQCTVPLRVPPPDGLLEAARIALKRARVRQLIRAIADLA